MSEIDYFELPRNDWYDLDGRIYKDVIIENLNACEAKLLELQKLDAIHIDPPDFDTIVYPDVDFESDDNCIINLKSFIQMMKLENYPIELNISGTLVKKVAYWNSSYSYVALTNKTPEGISETNKYVYVDDTERNVKCTSNYNTAINNIFIGVYDGDSIRGIHERPKANLNLLYLLANMKVDNGELRIDHNDNSAGDQYLNPYNRSRAVGFLDGESRTGTQSIRYYDLGRDGD